MTADYLRLALVTIALAALVQGRGAPTLVLVNGRVFTGVSAQPWAEAIAVDGDHITRVGTTAEIKGLAGPSTRVIDAAGRLVIPGINDAHVHMGIQPGGTRLEGPPAVVEDPSFPEVLRRLKAAVSKAPEGGWIFGAVGAAVLDDPKATRVALDGIAPNHRVMLRAWTGHGTLLNTRAMRHLGISESAPDPAGGFYSRVPGGRTLSGWAHEYAEYVLWQQVTREPPEDAQIAAFKRFADEAASLGITSVQSMMTSLPAAEAARFLKTANLGIHVRVIDMPMMPMTSWRQPASRAAQGATRVRVSGTKWILDGTPVERLMFLREPYTDQRSTRGRLNFTPSELTGFLRAAMAAKEQPMIHAVGDAAIDTVFDALETTGGERWQSLRPRLEHGDMLEPSHFGRARKFGLVLVQNPSHFMLRPTMDARLGSRISRTDLMKSAIAAGVHVALGSDGPLNPYLNISFATIAANNPDESMTREQALAAYTRGSALAEFEEDHKGTLAPGMLADFAMLSQDIFKVPTDALPATSSVLTVAAGRVIHER
jgi:predicted amidohydrolase YtcJ